MTTNSVEALRRKMLIAGSAGLRAHETGPEYQSSLSQDKEDNEMKPNQLKDGGESEDFGLHAQH
ncbi:MAG TPA: hypothetical protein VEC06_03155 [Paucimonas sp.]|nr:hypothetical protein [Paucimonas sp.]